MNQQGINICYNIWVWLIVYSLDFGTCDDIKIKYIPSTYIITNKNITLE